MFTNVLPNGQQLIDLLVKHYFNILVVVVALKVITLRATAGRL